MAKMTNQIECNLSSFVEENFKPGFLDLALLEGGLSELREYCQKSNMEFEKICDDYMNRESLEDWDKEEKIHETESEELIREYYSKTKMYLIELIVQEATVDYISLFWSIGQFAKKNKIQKVLDFGSGIGGLAVYLDSMGICCDCADIPSETWNYAGYRFQKKDMNVLQVTGEDLTTLPSKYDLVVSLDCLEHLKPMPKYIALFNSALKNNGLLLVKSSLYGRGLHLSSNYKYDCLKTFNGLMKNNSFDFNGQLITRLKRNFIVPASILELTKTRPVSGRKLIYKKSGE